MRHLLLAALGIPLVGCQVFMSEADRNRAQIREVASTYQAARQEAEAAGFRVARSEAAARSFNTGTWARLAGEVRRLREAKVTPDDSRSMTASEILERGEPYREALTKAIQGVQTVESRDGVHTAAASNALALTFFTARLTEGWARASTLEPPETRYALLRLLASAIEKSPDPVSFGMHVRLVSMQDNLHLFVRAEVERATSDGELDALREIIRVRAARSVLPLVLGEAQEVDVLFGTNFERQFVLTEDAVQSLQLPETFIGVTHGQARDALVTRAIQRGLALTKVLTEKPASTPDDLLAVIEKERAIVALEKDPTYALEYGRLALWESYIDLWRRSIQVQRVTEAALDAREEFLRSRKWPTRTAITDLDGAPLDVTAIPQGIQISARGTERLNRSGPLLLAVKLRETP